MNRIVLSLALSVVFTTSSVASDQNQFLTDRSANRGLPDSFSSLRLASPLQGNGANRASLRAAMALPGENAVIIRLVSPSVAEQKIRGKSASKAKKNLQAEQADLLSQVMALDPNARVRPRHSWC